MKDVLFCLRHLLALAWRLDRRRFVVGAGLLLLGALATPLVAVGAGRLVDHAVDGDPGGAALWALVVAVALTGDLMLGHFAHLSYFELAEQTEERFNRDLLRLVNAGDHLTAPTTPRSPTVSTCSGRTSCRCARPCRPVCSWARPPCRCC